MDGPTRGAHAGGRHGRGRAGWRSALAPRAPYRPAHRRRTGDQHGPRHRPTLGSALAVATALAGLAATVVSGRTAVHLVQASGPAGAVIAFREPGPEPLAARTAGPPRVETSVPPSGPAPANGPAPSGPSAPTGGDTAPGAADDGLLAADRRLVEQELVIGEGLTPKSVIYVPPGLFFTQNMMYSHTVVVYDRSFRRVATIDDAVDLVALGHPERPGGHRGSPVEATATADGRFVYVSNYAMEGPGFTNPGDDDCGDVGHDHSYVYRIDTATMRIDQAIEVGAVPKFLALTPDGRQLLVSNWCSWDLSIVDVATAREVARIDIGPYPRGIAVDPVRSVAYVAAMGTDDIAVVGLRDRGVSWIAGVGPGPRHLLVDPTGRWLYATLNAAGEVAKIDLEGRTVVATVATGRQPRTMAMSDDGSALYVVNYDGQTVSKVSTADLTVRQTVPVGDQPIGVAYDPVAHTVWVALYGGALQVLHDTAHGDS